MQKKHIKYIYMHQVLRVRIGLADDCPITLIMNMIMVEILTRHIPGLTRGIPGSLIWITIFRHCVSWRVSASLFRYSEIIWTSCCLKTLVALYDSTVYSAQYQGKYQSSALLAFGRGGLPLKSLKRQKCGKRFHVMTSPWVTHVKGCTTILPMHNF